MAACTDCQAINSAEWAAFVSGEFHTAYGLLAIGGLAIAACLGIGKYQWILYFFIFGLSVGILVDLWIHEYQH
jgi:hypothetical protein